MTQTQPTPVIDEPGDFAPWEKRQLIALFCGSVDVFRARMTKMNVDYSRPGIDPAKEPRPLAKPAAVAKQAKEQSGGSVTIPARSVVAKTPKPCDVCGDVFTPYHSGQRFCGDKCRGQNETDRKHTARGVQTEAPQPLLCARCNAPFTRGASKQAYCSAMCRNLSRYERRRVSRRLSLEPRDCAICGKQFAPKRSDSSVCSESCLNRRYKAAVKSRQESEAIKNR